MRKCLPDQTLLLMFEGEGTSTDRAHLEACDACADRYRRLVCDLQVIGQILREEPPRQPLYRSSSFLTKRWIPAVAALALIVVSVWGVMRMERKAPVLSEEARSEDVSLFVDDVSMAIFAAADDNLAEISYADSDFSYLNTALGEDGSF